MRQGDTMKRAIIAIIITLLGIGTLAYPKISNYLAEINGSQVIREYAEAIGKYSDEELAAAWAAAEQYNESLTGSPVHDPFLEGSGMALQDDYLEILDLGGIMGYVEIPKISVYLPIYHGTGEDALNKGIGHLEGSTMPIGGPDRHSVLTGHTGLVNAKLFTDLVELEKGDLFYIHVLGQILAYEVDQIKVVEPHVTEDLRRGIDKKDYSTLLTCTPYGVNSHRLLVRGIRTDYKPEVHDAITQISESGVDTVLTGAVIVTTAVMGTLVVIALVLARKKRRKQEQDQEQERQEAQEHAQGQEQEQEHVQEQEQGHEIEG